MDEYAVKQAVVHTDEHAIILRLKNENRLVKKSEKNACYSRQVVGILHFRQERVTVSWIICFSDGTQQPMSLTI